jgi:hypothetical protein
MAGCRCEKLFEQTGYEFDCERACPFPPEQCVGSEDPECLIPEEQKDELDTPIPPGPGA